MLKIQKINQITIYSLCLLLLVSFVFQGQTFYGKRKTGYYETQEDGNPFGFYVPRSINRSKKRYPLLVVMGMKASDAQVWGEMSDQKDVIVLAVQPKYGGGHWWLPTDLTRAVKKIEGTLRKFPIDRTRVWTVGYLNSGNIALMLGINHPELLTAAAGVDSKVVNTVVSGYDEGDGSYVGMFDFQKKPDRQIPLLLLDFGPGSRVSYTDQEQTRDVLAKYNYPVEYKDVYGDSRYPDKDTMKMIYDWFKGLKKESTNQLMSVSPSRL